MNVFLGFSIACLKMDLSISMFQITGKTVKQLLVVHNHDLIVSPGCFFGAIILFNC